ncbi:isopentenyl-diphosphate delta-isomerase [Mycolicibacterium duvalii]|uniref:Isopentenyl-diphosphate Delta-isomerase n=1 Tax=Mycolicibacterium duvalii TaxID=39688 RepID=A0A7I7K4F4_9MYCO|nr:isopentenyl-diphosphate Delta-isomerase [Mycolicibacterium duvalii]MCV7367119.1 isopentenyl-diphosphate Delta-isomerase [Mycolicibacterium duvalii]PEG42879.1 isopentenyl-diphosphate delta-isomerase [Mycolicibacterium duvalii]BBX18331.1 isopentenyl-diphosphate Delta-isomerase [Mycolicibacterium duvalii]
MTSVTTPELVVLVDDAGRTIGSAPKSEVHHSSTPLHLAFSCYLFDDTGRVLLTRRALHKRTFAGVWTNSCCGHPAPGEAIEDAVARRVREELGLDVAELRCALPDFRYYAVAADGVVENELCPVYCARAVGPVQPNPDEVMDYVWVEWEQLRAAAGLGWALSPWATEQIPLLGDFGVFIDAQRR